MKRTDKSKWRKIGGGSLTLKNNQTIRSGEEFYADLDDIPMAFRDSVELVEKANGDIPTEAEATPTETPLPVNYTKKERNKGWWDVFGEDGSRLNDRALRKNELEVFIQTLQ